MRKINIHEENLFEVNFEFSAEIPEEEGVHDLHCSLPPGDVWFHFWGVLKVIFTSKHPKLHAVTLHLILGMSLDFHAFNQLFLILNLDLIMHCIPNLIRSLVIQTFHFKIQMWTSCFGGGGQSNVKYFSLVQEDWTASWKIWKRVPKWLLLPHVFRWVYSLSVWLDAGCCFASKEGNMLEATYLTLIRDLWSVQLSVQLLFRLHELLFKFPVHFIILCESADCSLWLCGLCFTPDSWQMRFWFLILSQKGKNFFPLPHIHFVFIQQ